jgi:uncharacterized protein (TIGR03032 family)
MPTTGGTKQERRVAETVKSGDDAAGRKTPGIEFSASRNFRRWMTETGSALGFTTYQGGGLVMLGVKADGFLERSVYPFDRCMGMACDEGALWVASRFQLWRFSNNLSPSEAGAGYARAYRPRVAYVTGDIDVHEVAIDGAGRPVFVNTAFSCLATVSDRASFEPLWRPSFVSRLAAEDRCHLNGLALRDGAPAFVTAFARSDLAEGWRDRRRDGGLVIDVASGEAVAEGLSMPHSPRWRDDRLWVLNSGEGSFGRIDLATGRFEEIAMLPGYPRGLAFVGRYAVVGLSKPREAAFTGLRLQERLTAAGAAPRCGLRVIDLDSGDVVHGVDLTGQVGELFDVSVFEGAPRVALAGGVPAERSRLVAAKPPGA